MITWWDSASLSTSCFIVASVPSCWRFFCASVLIVLRHDCKNCSFCVFDFMAFWKLSLMDWIKVASLSSSCRVSLRVLYFAKYFRVSSKFAAIWSLSSTNLRSYCMSSARVGTPSILRSNVWISRFFLAMSCRPFAYFELTSLNMSSISRRRLMSASLPVPSVRAEMVAWNSFCWRLQFSLKLFSCCFSDSLIIMSSFNRARLSAYSSLASSFSSFFVSRTILALYFLASSNKALTLS
mmetsp:Transcript_52180/g.77288  ORF Transcript_52180/g.77288 Transcript_52180/m.77288 type:complete len:238 (-) Transcript_52180:412-1125(-)